MPASTLQLELYADAGRWQVRGVEAERHVCVALSGASSPSKMAGQSHCAALVGTPHPHPPRCVLLALG